MAPRVKFTHCIIHRESLARKTLDSELNSVLKCAIKIVNHIKSRPVNSRLLATLCNEMGSQHEALLFYTGGYHEPNTNILTMNDKVDALMKKLERFGLSELNKEMWRCFLSLRSIWRRMD